MKGNTDVLIIGGGLAGLTAAIHLAKTGRQVVVLEKNSYPKHKVCGEFISNEVLPYLQWLEIDIESFGASQISRTTISTSKGHAISAELPLGGFGISRYTLDELLFQKAKSLGCQVICTTVNDISFESEVFTVLTDEGQYYAPIALGAYGKRTNLDVKLNRSFISRKSPWLAVKMHYKGMFPDDLVALHNFKGGYCGISKVESGIINVCWLADYDSFKKYKNIADYESEVLAANPLLRNLLQSFTPIFEKPLVISQISFASKNLVEGHMLMIGDGAGLIHPLCGNGMAMALHSAKIAGELADSFHSGAVDRRTLENMYQNRWKAAFSSRIKTGRVLATLLRNPVMSSLAMQALTLLPSLLPAIIKQTHGKPIKINTSNA